MSSNHSMATLPVYDPRSGQILREISVTPLQDMPTIMKRAQLAQESWAKQTVSQRSDVLKRIVQHLKKHSLEVAQAISVLNGKTQTEALVAEIYPTLSHFSFFAKKAPKALQDKCLFLPSIPVARSFVTYDPLGVVGIISAWNYPFMLSLQDVAPALMAGNAVILKPSEYSAGVGQIIEKLLEEAGLPHHLVQVIYGKGDLGQALITSGIKHLSFIGSTRVGKIIYKSCADQMITCTLELGGKDAAIVLDDANLEKTVEGISWAAFTNCGQTCASVETCYVPMALKGRFQKAISSYLANLPLDSFGMMNTQLQSDIVRKQKEEAMEKGATILYEKVTRNNAQQNPFHQNPTVLENVPKGCALRDEETFGPLLPIVYYDRVEDVLQEINSSPYGLTASVWTEDFTKGEAIARRIDCGVVTINDHMITPGISEAPWGGHKSSGKGSANSLNALYHYSKERYVYHDRGLIRYKFWQYPFSNEKLRWILAFQESLFHKNGLVRLWYKIKTTPKLLFGI